MHICPCPLNGHAASNRTDTDTNMLLGTCSFSVRVRGHDSKIADTNTNMLLDTCSFSVRVRQFLKMSVFVDISRNRHLENPQFSPKISPSLPKLPQVFQVFPKNLENLPNFHPPRGWKSQRFGAQNVRTYVRVRGHFWKYMSVAADTENSHVRSMFVSADTPQKNVRGHETMFVHSPRGVRNVRILLRLTEGILGTRPK